jgi:membrane protease subunit (stomatin/prohibitin family)
MGGGYHIGMQRTMYLMESVQERQQQNRVSSQKPADPS